VSTSERWVERRGEREESERRARGEREETYIHMVR
jgi:hypothetical protein